MLVRGPAKGKSLKGLLAALNLSQRTLGEAGDSRASSFRQLSSGRPSTRGQQPLPTSPLQEVLKLSTEAGRTRLIGSVHTFSQQEAAFSTFSGASAPARPAKSAPQRQQRTGTSGYKQRAAGFPPREAPDVSTGRFREISEKPSFRQLLAQGATALSPEQRQILVNKGKNLYPQPQNKPAAPWTPTRLLQKRKVLTKRMEFLMEELEKEQEAEAMKQRAYPKFGPGSVLELTLAVPENKGKPAVVKGVCIAKKNRGFRTSFTLLNHLGTFGQVERTFPLYSPSIRAIKVYEHRHVRRAKLYYLRDRNPKEYRVN